MIGIFSFLVFLWCYVQVFFFGHWFYCVHFLPFILIAKLLIERSNSECRLKKSTKDADCQTCLATTDVFADGLGDEEADMLDDAMALQSPNFAPPVNLNPFTNPFYEFLHFDDPLDYLWGTEQDGECACAQWILKHGSFFGE
ncbi:hypothetical protein CDAR_618001 [Caerostris darwini]|uniref:Uncharacterized protein n=1 Tax=Caerostris darwini TaxID=1538125 RepID=A0AAV4SCK0_9ARAC|nr:hypothetical protein CDAR_618001 [Caerostris darwini]